MHYIIVIVPVWVTSVKFGIVKKYAIRNISGIGATFFNDIMRNYATSSATILNAIYAKF